MEGELAGAKRLRIEVVPLGPVDQVAVSVAAAHIQTFIGLAVDVVPPWPDPAYAVIPVRGQYNALPILKALGAGAGADIRRLGIFDGDLCLPILTYVFGEAQVNGQAAVVALCRLKKGRDGQRAPSSLILERLGKVAVHEMCHVLGVKHCRAPHCLMSFALGLDQLDALALRFCPDCERILVQRICR
jgi:archaemetzincin